MDDTEFFVLIGFISCPFIFENFLLANKLFLYLLNSFFPRFVMCVQYTVLFNQNITYLIISYRIHNAQSGNYFIRTFGNNLEVFLLVCLCESFTDNNRH